RFVFTAPRDGSYLLEVRDNRYKPGGRYRLRLGDFPLISTTPPLFAQRNSPSEMFFRGLLAESTQPLTILPAGGSGTGEAVNLSAKLPGRQSSGWAALGLTENPVVFEKINGKDSAVLAIPGI